MSSRLRRAMLVFVALTAAVVVLGPEASAATIVVTSTADGGPGSLRAAFTTANGNGQDDEIVLASGATYLLTNCGAAAEEDVNADGDLDHTPGNALTITGNGATIRNTCPDERVIQQLGTGLLAVQGLTITGGSSLGNGGGIASSTAPVRVTDGTFTGNSGAFGGAVYTPPGDVTIVGSIFSGNRATGMFGSGGAIYSSVGTISIVDSSFTGNTAANDGGAIRTSSGATSITGSTFAGNTSGEDGGALRSSSGAVTAVNITVTGNTAVASGGGIYVNIGPVAFNNVTIVGNDAGAFGDALHAGLTAQFANTILHGPGDDCGGGGTFTSNGYNIASDASCNLSATGDKPNTNALLGPLADNGGPTQTHALLKGSPAIAAGNPGPPGSGGAACAATDQRGLPRNCDIGAYELVLCRKVPVNRVGTELKDFLVGTPGADGLVGFGNGDRLFGKGGKDGLCGGPGKDVLQGGGGKDRLDGGPGKDLCAGQAGRDKAKACETEKSIP